MASPVASTAVRNDPELRQARSALAGGEYLGSLRSGGE